MSLPDSIPIFPLPNVVLFPEVELPLHIFEPRYREMVADAMAGDGLIGMVLLRPQWGKDYYEAPPVYPIGCVGRIEQHEALADGRSNLVLRGERAFEIRSEIEGRTYRQARVSWREADSGEPAAGVGDTLRASVLRLLQRAGKPGADQIWEQLPKPWTKLVNLLAFGLPFEEVEKMALLECSGCAERAQRMVEVLEFRLAEQETGTPGGGPGESWH